MTTENIVVSLMEKKPEENMAQKSKFFKNYVFECCNEFLD